MSDIRMTYDNQKQRADIDLESLNGKTTIDVQTGHDLETSVLISLMSDQVAEDDWFLTANRRGWWADAYRDRVIGSRIWQLTIMTVGDPAEYIMRAQAYCEEALQWLVDLNIAKTIKANAYFTDATQTTLAVDITVTKPDGLSQQFSYVWNEIQ